MPAWALIVRTLSLASSGRDRYARLCRAVVEGFGFSRALIATVDARSHSLIGRGGYEASLTAPAYRALLRLYRIPLEPDADGKLTVAGWCIRHRSQAHVEDATDYSFRSDETKQQTALVKALGLKAYVLTPLVHRGRAFGILGVDRKHEADRFSPADLRLLDDIAGLLALGLGPVWEAEVRGSAGAPYGHAAATGPPPAEVGVGGGAKVAFQVLDALGEGVLLVDGEARVRYANRAAVVLLEQYPWAMAGRPLDQVLPAEFGATLGDTAAADGEWEGYRPVRVGGGVRRLHARCIRLRDSDEVLHVVVLTNASEDAALTETRVSAVSRLVHDLKAPLQSVIGFAELLQLGRAGELTPEQREFAARIEDGGELMLQLVNRIVEVGRFDADTGPVMEPVAVEPLVEEVAKRLAGKALLGDVTIRSRIAPDLCRVLGNRLGLVQLLQNVLDNAISASAGCGVVEIEVAADSRSAGSCVRFEVRNTGGRMARVDHGDAGLPEPSGSGLGLSIARDIVEAHGGEIWISGNPRETISVVFTLPVADAALTTLPS